MCINFVLIFERKYIFFQLLDKKNNNETHPHTNQRLENYGSDDPFLYAIK